MKKLKKIILLLLIFFVVVLPLVYYFSVRVEQPVEITDIPTIQDVTKINDSTFQYKDNWLKKNKFGIWELYLKGGPVERGLAFGVLCQPLQEEKEKAFISEIQKRIPSSFYLNFLKLFIGWFNKDLDEYIPIEYQKEIYASSRFMPDEYDFVGPKYMRALNYHAAHDIGHALQNMKMVGCTSFAVQNDKSADSSLIVGRNFDFYFGEDFAKDKILTFIQPDSGYAFSSITWAGFSGVVSGMNKKGLTITLNSAKSDIPTNAKTPVSIIARTIIQYASTIDEAYQIASSMDAFVTETYLIASASENKVAIIEKTESETKLFTSGKNYIVATNHLQNEFFEDQALNIENLADEVSPYRFKRVNQLLSKYPKLDYTDASEILRNQRGLDDADLGLANEKYVNQLIAHHSIILKPQQGIIWLAATPYCLGAYSAYNINSVFNDPAKALTEHNYIDSLTIVQDPFLSNIKYQAFRKFNSTKEHIMEYLFSGKEFSLTNEEVNHFIENNPNSFLPYYYLGQYFYKKEDYENAVKYFEKGLSYETARKSEKDFMESSLKEAKEALHD